MTSEAPGGRHAGRMGLPARTEYVAGGLGGAWLIGWLGWHAWSMFPSLSIVGRGLLGGIWLCAVALVLYVLAPRSRQRDVVAGEVGNLWTFLLGSQPTDPGLRALWLKFRRTLAILGIWTGLWLLYGVAVTLGLAKA